MAIMSFTVKLTAWRLCRIDGSPDTELELCPPCSLFPGCTKRIEWETRLGAPAPSAEMLMSFLANVRNCTSSISECDFRRTWSGFQLSFISDLQGLLGGKGGARCGGRSSVSFCMNILVHTSGPIEKEQKRPSRLLPPAFLPFAQVYNGQAHRADSDVALWWHLNWRPAMVCALSSKTAGSQRSEGKVGSEELSRRV